ncbi:hypothetical protein Ato02nite_050430 [Paractinoplanes toevensis]|uniref:Nucleoside 2-deoxyribosyltransferase n=1 Tax=Paractinoplanes toevensis TaxID=571911 RepID=A0A919TF50_9ACTN|nr:hypothetical protein Ato02nite_050430 [Actinoplanes toevensis]
MALEMRFLGTVRPTRLPLTVYPHFGPPSAKSSRADIFVLMPFSPAFRPVYTECIRVVAENLGLTAERADDLFTSNQIMEDVWSGINEAGAIVADCTTRNPNVFYEIGIAHTVGKPVILLTRDVSDIPIDLRHFKYLLYETSPTGAARLREDLTRTITTIFGLDQWGYSKAMEGSLPDSRATPTPTRKLPSNRRVGRRLWRRRMGRDTPSLRPLSADGRGEPDGDGNDVAHDA